MWQPKKKILTKLCWTVGLVQLYPYTDYPGDSEEKSLQFSWGVYTRYKNAISNNEDSNDLVINFLLWTHTVQNPLYLLTHSILTTTL